MDEAVASPAAHALVITGSGRAFCAGADLAFVEGAGAQDDAFDQFLAEVGETFRRLERLPLPTIAAINGFALAGGLELVLCCDMAIAAFVQAEELRHSGLLNDVVPGEQLEGTVDDLVRMIAAKSPLGLRRMKQLVDDALQQSVDAGLRAELIASSLHAHSADMSEGLAAFREKRPPKYTDN